MKATLDIDDDVLQAAEELSSREQKTTGKLISEWARRGLRNSGESSPTALVANGFELLPAQGRIVTGAFVRQILEESGDA